MRFMTDDEKAEVVTTQDQNAADPTAVGLIWQKRRFLLRFVLVCNVLAGIGILLWPNKYESTVSLMPPVTESSSTLTGMVSGVMNTNISALGDNVLGLRSKDALYIVIFRSSSVQDVIINHFGLREEYHVRYMADARRKLTADSSVDSDTKSGVITITVTDHDRYRAAEIAEAFVQEMNRVLVEKNNTAAHLERVFIEQRLGEVNQDLKDSSAKLAQFSSKNMTLDMTTQGKAMMDASSNLEGKLIAAKAQLSGLQKYYTNNNPRVASLEATVSELQQQLNRMGTGNLADGASDQIYPSLRELPLLSETYQDLYRHVKIDETLANQLTLQDEAAKVDEAKELPVLQVLDPANVAEKKAGPHRGIIIVLSFLFFTSLGVFLILVEAHWKDLDPSDKKKLLAAELAGYGRQILSRRWKRRA